MKLVTSDLLKKKTFRRSATFKTVYSNATKRDFHKRNKLLLFLEEEANLILNGHNSFCRQMINLSKIDLVRLKQIQKRLEWNQIQKFSARLSQDKCKTKKFVFFFLK